MPSITLPDGSQRQFDSPVSVHDVASAIGPGLAKAALAGVVDGREVDTSHVIDGDASLAIVTERDAAGLEVIRHSTAHLLAMAVQELFPGTQVTIGPVIEDGFYYDFASGHHFTPEDLEKIEQRMEQIAADDLPVQRVVMSRERAIELFRNMGEHYKVQIIESLPEGEELSIYQQGPWMDLCRGPHVPSTGKLKAFKLTKVAGAYWRGDSNNEMLQRIYGTAWANKKQLNEYLTRIEEAEKRDHRKIGKKLDLFHTQEEAPGMVFWHPDGWTLYQAIEQYMRQAQRAHGYQEIRTPQLVDMSLWERSGHADKFGDDMFTLQSEERQFAVKPMNCPCHVQIFNQGLKSYRDLPLRMAEFGSCNRYEPSGALHGIMRVRGFTQDDGHIFCREDQIEAECAAFITYLSSVYKDLGFENFEIMFATRPEKRVGTEESWDHVENALENAIKATGHPYTLDAGEGAFYGPKLDFKLTDAIGREWQCGTFQVDPNLPERLDATYVAEDGAKHRPYMLHRACLGSFERFIGILIENSAGKLPFWLAPRQVVVASIISDADDYVHEVVRQLRALGVRAEADTRNEKINYKVREHSVGKVPVILAVGAREVQERTVTVRRLGEKQTSVQALDDVAQALGVDATPPDQL